MSTNDDNIHLLPLDDYNDFENSSNESEDDSIEVVSNVDVQENQIIDMTTYFELNISSDGELEINGDDNYSSVLNVDNNRSLFDDINNSYSTLDVVVNRCPTLDLNNKRSLFNDTNYHSATLDDACSQFNSDASNDDDEREYRALNISSTSVSSHPSLLTTNTIASSNNGIKETSKRKRRQWSVAEKLDAIATFKLNRSKHRTAMKHSCTTAQLRKWLHNEIKLIDISKEKKGRKRRRLGGAGKKLKYIDLDLKLLAWYREHRTKTDPNSSTFINNIRREKVSFKQLQRQGAKLSRELKHNPPSCKWYYRFMKRHRLSLQRPKRQQKIPLIDAYALVSSFHSYIRRASKWGPNTHLEDPPKYKTPLRSLYARMQ
ncbi:unnamed protein product [Rotaria sp. Silwood2]|nr:unnamed protein product [Rotaria sp. Silwood2]CAF3331112.1 unnamed protein product [Rotaria sp. Silwood2]CAF4465032.1 unnamed protein product [Rotaria sp. Silwood2]CAF4600678.1 unnamed protein product [Rotaria sp. Silwood2]